MPSIFTRSRTTSTPKPRPTTAPDEFGRVTSRTSISSPSSKKDKKKEKAAAPRPSDSLELPVTEGDFLSFYIPPDSEERANLRRYGYLSHKCEVVLGVDDVSRLVDIIARELTERGHLTTPLLFSSQALDISPSRVHKLVDSFLATCPSETYRAGSPVDKAWLDEARFAGPHELAMVLRWALARILRLVNGQESRGILNWELYLRWREDEAALLYPSTYFTAFLSAVPSPIQRLLSSLLALLSRLAAHATSSGLTPPMLASLFGPLLFGLGSSTLSFHHTYGAYLRSSHATEHLLLAYIRAQPPPLPSRLADWIRGYPTMLPQPNRLDKARPGAKLKKLNTVKRYVRLYSQDLVKTAASWDLGNSKEWNRVVTGQHAIKMGGPRYSDPYRKQMGLSVNEHPETGLPPSSDSSLTSSVSENDHIDPLAPNEDQLRFRSLTDLKWGEFESMGFLNSSEKTEKRLEFDLNEGARNALPQKRTTLTWSDFSQTGFTRNDAPLSATLQFAAPLSHTISAWPSKQHEIHSKLKKAQKGLPSFSWDTTPILGGEEAVEESFLDIWCDVLYGSGWVRREERVWRDCSWVLVEYKATPQNRPNHGPLPHDPRTATSLWLYEEFIPSDYKSQLSQPKRKYVLPSLTLPFSSKQQAYNTSSMGNVNTGGPSGQGYTTRLPSARELEFEGLLQREASTKIISLGHGGAGGTGGVGVGAGGRESTMSATLSTSELAHGNVSDLGHSQGSGEYSTQYVDGSREGSGAPYYVPSMQGTPNAHVSSSIAPVQDEKPTATDVHSIDTRQHPPFMSTAPPSSSHLDPRLTTTTQPSQAQTNAATPTQGGFFTAMTTPRKSPARFLSRVGRSKSGNGGGGVGEEGGGGGGLIADESGGIEKTKRNGKERLKAKHHSILRKGAKGSEETSIEFETRTIFGVEEDGEDTRFGDERHAQQQMGGGDGEKTPTQLKFSRAYNHSRNISKDDAWVDILVAGSTTGTPGNPSAIPTTPTRPRRSSDPESTRLSSSGTSSHPLHDPDRVREEIRQALKGAGPRPAEFSDNDEEADNNVRARVARTFLPEDQHPVDEYAESEVTEEDDEDVDDEALYGRPESFVHHEEEGINDSTNHRLDFLNGAANAGRVSLSTSSSSPHDDGNGHHNHKNLQVPSSTGSSLSSSGKNIRPIKRRDPSQDDSIFLSPPHVVPSSTHDSKIPRLRPPNLETAATGLRNAAATALPISPSHSLEDVPDIDDNESQVPDDDDSSSSKLIDAADLLSGLAVNPATPRYVHGAPLHNVVEEEEE